MQMYCSVFTTASKLNSIAFEWFEIDCLCAYKIQYWFTLIHFVMFLHLCDLFDFIWCVFCVTGIHVPFFSSVFFCCCLIFFSYSFHVIVPRTSHFLLFLSLSISLHLFSLLSLLLLPSSQSLLFYNFHSSFVFFYLLSFSHDNSFTLFFFPFLL